MNKRGQLIEILFFCVIALVIFVSMFSNPYEAYKRDCIKIYKEEFRVNGTCIEGTGENWVDEMHSIINGSYERVPCEKIDYYKLSKYCLDKYSKKNE